MTITSKRIHDLAKDYKVSSHAMLKIVQDLGYSSKSHMSVVTPDVVNAVSLKFAQEKQQAKKEMEAKQNAIREAARLKTQREAEAKEHTAAKIKAKAAAEAKAKEAPKKQSSIKPGTTKPTPTTQGGGRSKPGLANMLREAEKKKRRRDRRKKKDSHSVNQADVAKSFRATMADLSSTKTRRKYKKNTDDGKPREDLNVIEVNEYISVGELAKVMDVKAAEVVAKLLEMGMMATINQRLDMDTIEMVAEEFDFQTKAVSEVGEESLQQENEAELVTRAPVVTVMGHVDHGKTSLLDYIRKTNIVAGEAGAITQHIGAYEVHHKGHRIVFLDTPGHEAFTAMRSRGVQLTDIVVLIIAADEGLRPQTIEAIDHARAASVPIVVAMSKIDKPGADLEKVKTQLSNQNLLVEDWGGKIIAVGISSKTGEGVDKLLEMISLQAEMLDLKADPSIRAQGIIVDSRLEKGRGAVATILVQRGSCKIGDPMVAGVHRGRIRTIVNDRDQKIKKIGPSTPVQITGLSGVPQAGDSFLVACDDQEAREITTQRSQIKREYDARRPGGAITLERVFDQIKEGHVKEVRLIIKADVDGSVEVLSDTLGKIETEEVKTNIIHRGVGAITESDVLLAATSDAIIIGFQISPDSRAREAAVREKVDIRKYNVIYEAENDVKKALEGLLSPDISEKFVGLAEVRETFKVPKIGLIAGSYIKEGRINRKDKVHLMRDGKLIYTGLIASLRRFKEDTREVKEGFECGIGIENFNDVKVGDTIEAVEIVETARTLS